MKLPRDLEAQILARPDLIDHARKPTVAAPALDCDEKTFMAAVIAFAKSRAWLVYHTHDSRRSERGFPDLVCVRFQRVLYIELKTEVGKETEPQREWRLALERATGAAYLWRPSNWSEVVGVLT